MASKKSRAVAAALENTQAAPSLDLDKAFDSIFKEMHVTASTIQRGAFLTNSVSSGYLTLDLILKGGYGGGRFIVLAGLEGGGKSTVSVYAMREAIKQAAYVVHFDYEGSTDSHFAGRLGLRTDWTPEARAKQPVLYRRLILDTGEEAFNIMHRFLKQLPDTKEGAGIPVVFVLDSLPAMLPKAVDVDDEAGGLAMQARMFSGEIRKIRTLITKKNAIVFAINQLREKPGPSFGDPSYEPCGIAPRQFSDVRLRFAPRSSPKPWSGRIVTEPCWDGVGVDTYRHTLVTTVKNKVSGMTQDCWLRLCLTERGQPGTGVDRVFDTYQYLKMTGQWQPAKGLQGVITFPGLPYTGKTFTWAEFKALIKDPENKKNADTYLPNLCRKQLELGDGLQRHFDASGGVAAPTSDEDAEMVPDKENEEE